MDDFKGTKLLIVSLTFIVDLLSTVQSGHFLLSFLEQFLKEDQFIETNLTRTLWSTV